MSLMDSHNFLWSDMQKPQKNIDLGKFFENKAYQNLFSELKGDRRGELEGDEDDASTNAPDSRTTSNLIPMGYVDKAPFLVKIEEKPNETSKTLDLSERIRKMLSMPVDSELNSRFCKVFECEKGLKKLQKRDA